MKSRLKRWINGGIGWCAAGVLLLVRATCRLRTQGDPRPDLRARGVPYIYCLLHAHQVSALVANDEQRGRLAAMVSRSADGDLLVPSLTARGVRAVRGSSGSDRKGGRRALVELRRLLRQRIAVLLAVDGPNGPRNVIHRGVAVLARLEPDAVVLPTLALSTRRWIVARTWDRIQLPLPFSTVSLIFAPPIEVGEVDTTDELLKRIASAMEALESQHDPDEAGPTLPAPPQRGRPGPAPEAAGRDA